MKKIYEITSEYHVIKERKLRFSLWHPTEPTEYRKIMVLQTHSNPYVQDFAPLLGLARRGFTVMGVPQGKDKDFAERMLDCKASIEFARSYPGIEKVVVFGHSQGGCIWSQYQDIAENGTERFRSQEREIPYPELPELPGADGIMLVDTNYGIMSMLALDPAVKSLKNGFERIPELDLYNPENGYVKDHSRYKKEFITRFQKAQQKRYEELLAYAKQRAEDIRLGKGMFKDNEVMVIPGAGGGSSSNKLFIQDNSLLNHTRGEYDLLHSDGTITRQVIPTVRTMNDAPHSDTYKGGVVTTIRDFLLYEYRFSDFGYDESSMWGVDWDFFPMCSQGNVKGITIPMLLEGNTGSHEFINIEYTYENAKSKDKTVIFVEGADHGFEPVKASERYPGEFGDPAETFAEYAANWLTAEGRFM